MVRQGDWFAFRIADVYLPVAEEVLRGLDERTLLLGKLVGFSDSGLESRAFCVVQLEGGQKVIVPTEKLGGFEIRECPRPADEDKGTAAP